MSLDRRQHRSWHAVSRKAWLCALLLALVGAAPANANAKAPAKTQTPCRDVALQPTATNLVRINAATLCLLNRIRGSSHLRPLRLNRELQGVASGQTRDMVLGDYFGDDSVSGLTPMQRILATRYPGRAARVASAQNIGWAVGPHATPSAMVQAWMQSPPHRAIILTPSYRDVGVGVSAAAPDSLAEGRSGATYTLELGLRIFSASLRRSAAHR
jgi:uncharacterized protein YkwD